MAFFLPLVPTGTGGVFLVQYFHQFFQPGFMIRRQYIISDLPVKKFLTAHLNIFTQSLEVTWTGDRNEAMRFDTAVQAVEFEITEAYIFLEESNIKTTVVYWDTLESIESTDKTNERIKNGS